MTARDPAAVSPQVEAANLLWRVKENGGVRLGYLYGLLDAARDESIYPSLRRIAGQAEVASLYQGPTAEELAGVSPYLVHLGTGSAVFDWFWTAGWGKSWGIFFWSVSGFDGLRAHFRTLTRVQLEGGPVVLFRFYDPRVLRTFLPTCSRRQSQEIFGPVTYVYTETEDGCGIEEFAQGEGGPSKRFYALDRRSAA